MIDHNKLLLARRLRGYSQADTAVALGISQGLVSRYEQGLRTPAHELLTRISRLYRLPESFFTKASDIYPAFSYHRKMASLSQKMYDQIEAEANIRRLHVRKMLESIELDCPPLPMLPIDENGTAEVVARKLRIFLRLPKGPVMNLTRVVEEAGIPVFHMDFRTRHIDALTMTTPGLPPLVYLNMHVPPDRLRFTLAHELGHIVMHDIPSESMEKEANEFAAEFLMPEEEIRHSLDVFELNQLTDLKAFWRVSMQAILKRGMTLFPERNGRYLGLQRQMSAFGMRRKEPGDLEMEHPGMVADMISLFMEQLGYSVTEMASMLDLLPEEFEDWYMPSPPVLKLVMNSR